MTRVKIHVDGCACDQGWAHRPPATERQQQRRQERTDQAERRRHGKARGNAQRLARVAAGAVRPDPQPEGTP